MLGTKIKKEDMFSDEYKQAARWCNENGAELKEEGDFFLVVKTPELADPTAAEQVAALEAQTGLTRAMRELVLAENSGASEYTKAKAQEIETMAIPLRETKNGW